MAASGACDSVVVSVQLVGGPAARALLASPRVVNVSDLVPGAPPYTVALTCSLSVGATLDGAPAVREFWTFAYLVGSATHPNSVTVARACKTTLIGLDLCAPLHADACVPAQVRVDVAASGLPAAVCVVEYLSGVPATGCARAVQIRVYNPCIRASLRRALVSALAGAARNPHAQI